MDSEIEESQTNVEIDLQLFQVYETGKMKQRTS